MELTHDDQRRENGRCGRIRRAGPGARRLLRKIAGMLAGFAGVGAILGGFTGYWTTYRAV